MIKQVSIIFLLLVAPLSCCINIVAFTLPEHLSSKRYTVSAQISNSQICQKPSVSWRTTVSHCRLPSQVSPIEKGACTGIALYAHRTNEWSATTCQMTKILTSSMVGFILVLSAFAIDASRDISGQDWSNGNYEQQDFSGVIATGTNFKNSNLQGCNFNEAILKNADLSGADIRGASFKDSILDGTVLKDVNAVKTIFSASILDVESLENADLTDSLWPSKLQIMICDMPSLKGTSSSGVNTRDSILCSL